MAVLVVVVVVVVAWGVWLLPPRPATPCSPSRAVGKRVHPLLVLVSCVIAAAAAPSFHGVAG